MHTLQQDKTADHTNIITLNFLDLELLYKEKLTFP